MASVTLYHNPRCSKSRAALALLEERGADVEVIRYLDTPLDEAGLRDLLRRLGRPAAELVRRGEAEYKAAGLGPGADEDQLVAAIAAHPKLMERPVAVVGKRAVIGRPPENVLELLP